MSFKDDLQAVLDRDPAATNKFMVWLTYAGFKAIRKYRRAHWFYERGMKNIAILISARAKRKTGVDIHPAAVIGNKVFIDHAVGVVIGETCEIGNNVTIYQGVTLGGTGKDVGKRHPTIGDDVMISAGAKVLGPITIGKGSKIGAGSVVLKNVPPHCTVVGVPGRIVRMHNENSSAIDLNQTKLPDPVLQEFARLCKRIRTLELKLNVVDAADSAFDNDIFDKDKETNGDNAERENN